MNKQSLEQAILESSEPVLVHFGAPWCGPCRMIEPLLSRFQSEFGASLKLIGINADENLKLASQYRITTLPTLLFFEGGNLLHRMEGMYKRDALWAELTKLLPQSLQTTAPN
ncbi:MAG: thioredoxin fold domain-containing protein [Oscillatoriales cyanobacterium C42_A2020_001]|nr:thioredoxin fold domain-containing protein [Leptolyngbyaceae cyanobacterium C42_A2020_001]